MSHVSPLQRPVDSASLWLFRGAFGWLCVVLVVRYFAHDWIGHYFTEPSFFFSYFDAWKPLPGRWMYVEFSGMGVAALALALGVWPRRAAAIFWVLFTHQHFCDKAIYLNHYYFISLVAFLFIWLPIGRNRSVPAWSLWLMRAQIGLVYFYGGVGKLNSDWLIRAEPLRSWLHTSGDLALLGGLLDQPVTAYLMSWVGAFFDLSIVGFLLWPKTRRPAYVALIVFHGLTGLLFPIGLFPWLMTMAATVFFDPAWPRRWIGGGVGTEPPARVQRWLVVLLATHLVLQVLLPLRSWFYPGDVNWSEAGFRFSWKVMLIEKSGIADFRVVSRSGRVFEVNPRSFLTPLQLRMMSTQPDMIQQFAEHLVSRYERITGESVQVFANVQVSYNGRSPRPLVPAEKPLAASAK